MSTMKQPGIYLGFDVPNPKELPPTKSVLELPWSATRDLHEYTGDAHIITFGPNGSGKTRRLLIPNLRRLLGWSILVVDPKGTLAVNTARHRKEAGGNEIITLDPFGVIEQQYPGITERQPYLKSAGFNPVGALDPESDDFPDDAKAIAEALIRLDGMKETHWGQSAQELVAGLIMGARLDFGERASLEVIRHLIGLDVKTLGREIKQKGGEGTPGFIDRFGEDFPELAAKLSNFSEVSSDNRELMSILSTAKTQTGWLDSRRIKRDLRQGTHDFGMMKRKPVTVYLILPPRYLETHSTWLRLAITSVLMPLIRTIGGAVPVLFMLDEFAQLGRLEVIERNMALTREYGVKLWPILQDLSQLKDHYKERWESFIGNAGIKHLFAPQDHTTQEYFSKLSGQRDYWFEATGTTGGTTLGPQMSHSTGASVSWSKTPGPELWDKGLARMNRGQAVLFYQGFNYRAFLPDPSESEWLPAEAAMLQAAQAATTGKTASPPPRPDVIAVCPKCAAKLRLRAAPAGRAEVKCPTCSNQFIFEAA